MECEIEPASAKECKIVTEILRILGLAAASVAGMFLMPVVLFAGLLIVLMLLGPSQEALVRMVDRNLDLLGQAVVEAELLDEDVVEVSSYWDTPSWRRDDLGDIRGLYLRRDGGDGPDTYEPYDNRVFRRVLRLRFVEAIDVGGDGFWLDCGGVGIAPAGSTYKVLHQKGVLEELEGPQRFNEWPREKCEDGWLISYGSDDTLLVVPVTDEWFIMKESW